MPAYIGRPAVLRIVRGETGTRGLPGGGTLGSSGEFPISTISIAFEPTQDLVDPRIFTVADEYVPASVRIYWNGQRLRTSLLVVVAAGGTTTITLDASVPIELGDGSFTEGEGVKVGSV
jgi:hypothetical protein